MQLLEVDEASAKDPFTIVRVLTPNEYVKMLKEKKKNVTKGGKRRKCQRQVAIEFHKRPRVERGKEGKVHFMTLKRMCHAHLTKHLDQQDLRVGIAMKVWAVM